jgi:CO/xanthine dehydrogenase FAD-binding subunit
LSYLSPQDLPTALSAFAGGEPPCIVAGGTDLYPALRPGTRPTRLLDVTRIAGFSDITQTEAGLRFGAAVTWTQIVKADLPPAFDALRQAAREVGSLQIQNAGTIAGNLCNASPAADGVPPLLALDAQIELSSAARGTRRLDLSAFITGVRQTARAPDELVTAVLIPPLPQGMTSAFKKLGSRRYLVISIAMTAANLVLDHAGRIAEARIAVGACSAVAQRLPALEAALLGQRSGDVLVDPAHLAPLAPIDDVRGSGAYRLEAAATQIQRAIQKAAP